MILLPKPYIHIHKYPSCSRLDLKWVLEMENNYCRHFLGGVIDSFAPVLPPDQIWNTLGDINIVLCILLIHIKLS